jgi:hypothetical protein
VDKNYGGVVWTKHALERLKKRGLKQGDAWITWRKPDQSRYAKSKGAWIYYKSFGNQRIEVVAKKVRKGWIILSVWSKKVRTKVRRRKPFLRSLIDKIFKFKSGASNLTF